jgi:uncharacterized protein (DUF1330 family)
MPVYFIGQVKIDDAEAYNQYMEQATPSVIAAGARVLAADDHAEAIEGDWHGPRTVIMEFPDEASFRRWYDSPEYQAAKAIRLPAADLRAALVHGL